LSRPQVAALAVLELDGYAWRHAQAQDADVLERLAAAGSNRLLFTLPASTADFAAAISKPGFRQPMLCYHGTIPFGAAAYSLRNNHNLNLKLTCFFLQPELATLALAVYVRHLFWSLPMHRIHGQLPLVEAGPDYVRLLKAIGFREEGVVRGHVIVGGQPHDLAVMGVLREEFEDWCLTNESRLAL